MFTLPWKRKTKASHAALERIRSINKALSETLKSDVDNLHEAVEAKACRRKMNGKARRTGGDHG